MKTFVSLAALSLFIAGPVLMQRMRQQATEMGAILAPPMPAFYHRPASLDDIINQTINRLLDLLDIELPQDLFTRWQGGQPKPGTGGQPRHG